MRVGILPESIYKRSVERIVHKYNKDLNKGVAPCVDYAFLCTYTGGLGENSNLWESEIRLILISAYTEAAVAVKPAGAVAHMQANITIPVAMEEPELRKLMEKLVLVTGEFQLPISSIKVKTELGCNRIFMSFSMIGKMGEIQQQITRNELKLRTSTWKDIVLVGSISALGTSFIAEAKEEELNRRYSAEYVRRMKSVGHEMFGGNPYEQYFSELLGIIINELEGISLAESGLVHTVEECGLFAALWNMGKVFNCGLRINIKSIPIYQESVETCDFFDINPYLTYSGGCILIRSENGECLASKLRDAGYQAEHIGFLTDNHDRVIINGDEERFLTAPVMDEIYKLFIK